MIMTILKTKALQLTEGLKKQILSGFFCTQMTGGFFEIITNLSIFFGLFESSP